MAKIKHKQVGNTEIQVFQDSYDKYKTTVTRVEKLESKQLYWGYDKETAIEIYEECLKRFNIDKIESLNQIQWDN